MGAYVSLFHVGLLLLMVASETMTVICRTTTTTTTTPASTSTTPRSRKNAYYSSTPSLQASNSKDGQQGGDEARYEEAEPGVMDDLIPPDGLAAADNEMDG
jgi:hypothetical protein